MEELNKMAKAHNIARHGPILPYMPHRESVASLMQSDAVVIVARERHRGNIHRETYGVYKHRKTNSCYNTVNR